MKNKGISFRLNSTITTVAVLIIASVVYINYHFSNRILKDKIKEGAINQSNLVISKIARITVGTAEIARNVSYQTLYYYQHNDLDFFLNQVLESNKILESIDIELLDTQKKRLLQFSSGKPGKHTSRFDSLNTEQTIQKLTSGHLASANGEWSDPFYVRDDTTNLL